MVPEHQPTPAQSKCPWITLEAVQRKQVMEAQGSLIQTRREDKAMLITHTSKSNLLLIHEARRSGSEVKVKQTDMLD